MSQDALLKLVEAVTELKGAVVALNEHLNRQEKVTESIQHKIKEHDTYISEQIRFKESRNRVVGFVFKYPLFICLLATFLCSVIGIKSSLDMRTVTNDMRTVLDVAKTIQADKGGE